MFQVNHIILLFSFLHMTQIILNLTLWITISKLEIQKSSTRVFRRWSDMFWIIFVNIAKRKCTCNYIVLDIILPTLECYTNFSSNNIFNFELINIHHTAVNLTFRFKNVHTTLKKIIKCMLIRTYLLRCYRKSNRTINPNLKFQLSISFSNFYSTREFWMKKNVCSFLTIYLGDRLVLMFVFPLYVFLDFFVILWLFWNLRLLNLLFWFLPILISREKSVEFNHLHRRCYEKLSSYTYIWFEIMFS